MSYFQDALERQMTATGINQVELSRATGISQPQISKWLRGGQTSLSEDQMTVIANALSKDPSVQAALVAAHLQDEKFGPGSELIAISQQGGAPELPKTDGEKAIHYLSQLRIHQPEVNDLIITLAGCLRLQMPLPAQDDRRNDLPATPCASSGKSVIAPMNEPKQIPGCLPAGFDLDSLLTVEQAAIWKQINLATFRKRLAVMPGVIRDSRECVRIHPKTHLEKCLNEPFKT